ncbi:hypothetical protein H7J88_22705 [Mycolicibacterium flavescens]|uniref:hypothetical protein n=1 Tax=Mycolicibacterium flavescens TaxID=1776 RepID=UPI0010426519|nr:hypothetical protein [Mycolicibacterium flavescens]MCV7282448.1 hypothetical protein [Mycolicibacterium flavescens]
MVCAPPELRTITAGSSMAALEGEVGGSGSFWGAPDSPSVGVSDGEPGVEGLVADEPGPGDADDSSAPPADAAELSEASSAQATAGAVATAPPIPSATANAPTRPMYRA